MGRSNKFNLQYFPLEVGFFDDHKVISIEETAGVKGGYIALRLMAMVYDDKGYYLEWPAKFEYTAAKRIGNGVTGAQVVEVFKLCLKHDLFNEDLYKKHSIVTSRGIQKRWKDVMVLCRRKIVINDAFWLISSEEIPISSEEKAPPATFSTQKEIKGNEIEKGFAPGPPSPASISETEPYWELLVNVWFDFGKEKFREYPSFKAQDPKIFKRIIQLLKKRAASKKVEWNQDTGPQRLRLFLEAAYEDKWLSEHFLLSNLEKQYDQIIQRQASASEKKKANAPVQKADPIKTTGALQRILQNDIDYLYRRYLEDSVLTVDRINDPSMFDTLFKFGLINFDTDLVDEISQKALEELMVRQIEITDASKKKYYKLHATMEYFRQAKRDKKEFIFNL